MRNRVNLLLSTLILGGTVLAAPSVRTEGAGKGKADAGGSVTVQKLPVFTTGPWKGKHAVYRHPNFDAVMDDMGVISIQPLEGGKATGRPFVCYQVHCYYSKPKSDHIFSRPVISFADPPQPAQQPQRIRLKGMLEEEIPFEVEYEFKANAITATGGCQDHNGVTYPTRFRLLSRFPQSHNITPQTEQPERERLLKNCVLTTREMVNERRKTFRYPYYDIMKFSGPLEQAELKGPYGARVIEFTPGNSVEGELSGWIYSDNCPWQGYVIQYITQGKTIELRKNKAVMLVR